MTPVGLETIRYLLKISKFKIRVAVNQNIPTDFDEMGEILSEKRVEIVTLNFEDPISFSKSFENVHFVIFAPPVENRELVCDRIILTSTKFHVEKIAFLSILGANLNEEGEDYASSFIRELARIEENLKSTPLSYSILRPNFFQFGTSFLRIYENGIVKFPKAKASFIADEDIGKCLARVIVFEGYENQTYNLTGSEILGIKILQSNLFFNYSKSKKKTDLEAIAKVFSERFDGRDVDSHLLSLEEVEERMEEQMIETKKAKEWLSLFSKFTKIEASEQIEDGVKNIMGRKAITFMSWSHKNQSLFDNIDSKNRFDENAMLEEQKKRKVLSKKEERKKEKLKKEYEEWLSYIEMQEKKKREEEEEKRKKEEEKKRQEEEKKKKEEQRRKRKEQKKKELIEKRKQEEEDLKKEFFEWKKQQEQSDLEHEKKQEQNKKKKKKLKKRSHNSQSDVAFDKEFIQNGNFSQRENPGSNSMESNPIEKVAEDIIPTRFFRNANKFERTPAYRYYSEKKQSWISTNWASYKKKVTSAAIGILATGSTVGEKFSIFCSNRPEWTICHLAVLSCGLVSVPIHNSFAESQIVNAFNNCEPSYILIDNQKDLSYLSSPNILNFIPKYFIFVGDIEDGVAQNGSSIISWSKLISKPLENRNWYQRLNMILNDLKGENLAIINYSLDEKPLGRMFTHKALVSSVDGISSTLQFDNNDLSLSHVSLADSNEQLFTIYLPIKIGFEVCYNTIIEDLHNNMKALQPTFLYSAPKLWEKFYGAIRSHAKNTISLKNLDKNAKFNLKNFVGCQKLKFCVVNGQLPLPLLRTFESIGIIICVSYGGLEFSSMVTCNSPQFYKHGTVGRPLKGCNLSISKLGEIIVKGEMLFSGIYRNNELMNTFFTKDDWFITEDIGSIDESDYLSFIAGKDEQIITQKGNTILPLPIEKRIKTHPLVGDAIVVGNNRPFLVALITVEPQALKRIADSKNMTVTEALDDPNTKKRIILHLSKHIGNHINEINEKGLEKINAHTILLKEFSVVNGELFPSLKLNRKFIEEKYGETIETMYSSVASN